uniref:Uncharacterized protein n=1 Tax=Oryza punctata TaxID=4537 RepID=A0A0E0JSD9_ORYPU
METAACRWSVEELSIAQWRLDNRRSGDGVAETVPPLAGAGLPCACADTVVPLPSVVSSSPLPVAATEGTRIRDENESNPVPHGLYNPKIACLQSCPCLSCVTQRKMRGWKGT